MAHVVIYVPGLADKLNRAWVQRGAFNLWRLARHVHPYYFVVDWANSRESFQAKLDRLLAVIDKADKKGNTVSLVGASAGSSLALKAYSERKTKIRAVVSICGKLRNPETIPKELFAINPSFKESMVAFAEIEPKLTKADRKKVLIVKAGHDSYVPEGDGALSGAHTYHMISIGHVVSIMAALTIFRHRLIRFIKDA